MRFLARICLAVLVFVSLMSNSVSTVVANGEVLGVHILAPGEIEQANNLLNEVGQLNKWRYITIPYTLSDINRHDEWQQFFDRARAYQIVPIIRLATEYSGNSWRAPTRKNVVDLLTSLNSYDWQTEEKIIILFNEVNHAKEWGGKVDPEGYADILTFGAAYAKFGFVDTSTKFKVLPAAMDLAAPNGAITMEAFNYLQKMLAFDSEVFGNIDYWNSHSYPNPAFSAPPTQTGKNSLRGFQFELEFIKKQTGREYQVFITETGWEVNAKTRPWLRSYYTYALQHIWSDSRVRAVTPFVLKGDPGPFAKFGFFDRNDKPTLQFAAFKQALTVIK